jgi:hypothetical protein
MKWFFIFTFVAFAIFKPENAFAADVYNFQFHQSKVPGAQPQTKASETPASAAVKTPTNSLVSEVVQAETTPIIHQGWQIGVGKADVRTLAYHLAPGVAVSAGYQFSKYFGLQGQLMMGKDSDHGGENHLSSALGAKLTPFHIQVMDWDFAELSALFGIMNGVRESDTSSQRVSIYVGMSIALNFSQHMAFVADAKYEEGDSGREQELNSFVYKF